ncbi:hypothetical protein [Clostridium sp. SGI.024]|uniref:hypothetical protein n=1 Tax=Clostridium sp. SGI.024 TaxID=3420551 RepID=UPI003CFC5664
MGINIRVAKVKDYKSICNISKELHLYHVKNRPDIYKQERKPIYKSYYNEILKDNIEVIVITVDDKVVGYTIIRYVDLKNRLYFKIVLKLA